MFSSGQQRYLSLENVFMQRIHNTVIVYIRNIVYYLLEFPPTQPSFPFFCVQQYCIWEGFSILIESNRNAEAKGSGGVL